MSQLANRQKQIPGGLRFFEPRTKWTSQAGSFSVIVDQVIAHRTANSWLQLAIDRPSVENEVDRFNSAICEANGWNDYITGGDPPNPPLPPLPWAQRLANAAAGGEPVVEWLASKEEAVPQELSNKRAAICAVCPVMERGDLLRFFTLPVSNAIRAAYAVKTGWKLETPYDDRLQICGACDCPTKLKVHMPIDRVRQKLKSEQINRLHPSCWIPRE